MIGNGLTRPESCFPIWFYHCLPDPMLAVRNPLVFLVWWQAVLPIVTSLPIWVCAGRVRPLPIITTAQEETGDREMIWVETKRTEWVAQ